MCTLPLGRLTLVLLLSLAGCQSRTGLTRPADGHEWVYQAQGTSDLAQPLQAAFAEALEKSADGPLTFHLKLAAGTYEGFHLSLEAPKNRRKPVELVVTGQNGRATIEGASLKLGAHTVKVKDLTIAHHEGEGSTLIVTMKESFEGSGLTLVDNRTTGNTDAPIVELAPGYGKRATPTAAFTGCAFVGNRTEDGVPLIETPLMGRGYLASLTFTDTVLAGNNVDSAAAPWFTRKVRFKSVAVYGNTLRHGLLELRSPLVHVTIEESTMGSASAMFHHRVSPDVARDDFPPVTVEASTLFAAKKGRSRDVELKNGAVINTRTGEWAPAPAKWAKAALRGDGPSVAAVAKLLKGAP